MGTRMLSKRPEGYIKPGFELVWEVFKNSLESGSEEGGSFAAYHQGELVVNVWGGWADKESLRLWKEDTASFFFSTTKSVSSVVVAHLVDRGLLRYEDPISKHWPEFAEKGKGEITLETFISNRSGLADLEEPYQLSWLRNDPHRLGVVLARARPLWEPGKHHGYHPITFALYLDQIVRRTDPGRRSLAQYFDEEIAKPFDIDFNIGMPKQLQHRATRLYVEMQALRDYYGNKNGNFAGDPYIFSLTMKNPQDWRRTQCLHDPDFMDVPCGSSHGVGTARAVAKFHSILANGADSNGRRIISPDATERLQIPLSWGVDKTYGGSDIYSLGTSLLPVVEAGQVHYMVGHGGFGGQFAAADTKHHVGFAYVSNFLDPLATVTKRSKWLPLYEALFQCVLRVEGVTYERKTYSSFSDNLQPPHSKL
ncbi:beta-lactamase domain-containing protein 2-like [Haliotis cracherodii]|uniref:beta-lactamase domain-containing protein 2-like n=1 Tax=Haliotis cracherodii TaxID=6455 RepID=UPI0039E7E4AC